MFGKARAAPMKPLTISELEIQTAPLAAWLRDKIQQVLTIPVERTFLLTDSTAVLPYLQSTDKLLVFVVKSALEFLQLTTTDDWNYVQTMEIPADTATRGFSAKVLSESLWVGNTDFVRKEDWPFQLLTDDCNKIKRNILISDQVPSER